LASYPDAEEGRLDFGLLGLGAESDGGDATRGEFGGGETRVTVGVLLRSMGAPQEGQKRLSSGAERWHEEQII
jgi:hypothetical protein